MDVVLLILWVSTFFSIGLLLHASRLLNQLASSIVANFQDKTQCQRGQRACCSDKCCVWKREVKTEQSRGPVSWGAETQRLRAKVVEEICLLTSPPCEVINNPLRMINYDLECKYDL